MRTAFILLFFSLKIFSQDLEQIKSWDTLYIHFDKTKSFDDLHLRTDENHAIKFYIYIFPDAKFLKFLAVKNEKEIKIKKCVLEKKKEKIITIETIHKIGLGSFLNAINTGRKTIYIIDSKNLKRKITLKKAIVINTYDM